MSKFWDQQQPAQARSAPLVDEQEAQALIDSFQDAPVALDEVDDEEADLQEVLSNANLRLEQGRLYQMILSHDIFENLDADHRAIRNVTREFRKFARERMEVMLGMRQPSAEPQAAVVSSPFNDLEVVALKTIAAQMSKGKTLSEPAAQALPATPKKEGLTPLSGSTKPVFNKPLPKANPAPIQKASKESAKPTPQPMAPATALDESFLNKPIEQMTPDELLAYDQKAQERRNRGKAALPPGYIGVPSNQELEALYTQRLSNMQVAPGNAAAAVMSLLQRK